MPNDPETHATKVDQGSTGAVGDQAASPAETQRFTRRVTRALGAHLDDDTARAAHRDEFILDEPAAVRWLDQLLADDDGDVGITPDWTPYYIGEVTVVNALVAQACDLGVIGCPATRIGFVYADDPDGDGGYAFQVDVTDDLHLMPAGPRSAADATHALRALHAWRMNN